MTELTARNCRLRPFETSDAEALYGAVRESVRELQPWMPWCRPDYSAEESEAFIRHCQAAWERNEELNFAILDRVGQLVGTAGLNAMDWTNRRANLGYWIRSRYTGQGFATAATKLVAAFAFDEVKLNRVEIVVAAANEASQKVAISAGAVREGVARDRLLLQGGPQNAAIFSFVMRDRRKLPPLTFDGEPPVDDSVIARPPGRRGTGPKQP